VEGFRPIDVHRRIASTLTTGHLKHKFFFEGVDSAIIVAKLSEEAPDENTVELVLEATERAALSATFSLAYRYSQILNRKRHLPGLQAHH
jgi:hypothetical protein